MSYNWTKLQPSRTLCSHVRRTLWHLQPWAIPQACKSLVMGIRVQDPLPKLNPYSLKSTEQIPTHHPSLSRLITPPPIQPSGSSHLNHLDTKSNTYYWFEIPIIDLKPTNIIVVIVVSVVLVALFWVRANQIQERTRGGEEGLGGESGEWCVGGWNWPKHALMFSSCKLLGKSK